MKKIISIIVSLVMCLSLTSYVYAIDNDKANQDQNLKVEKEYEFNYQGHSQNVGWQKSVQEGEIAGTTGKSKRLEALKYTFSTSLDMGLDVKYRSNNTSWLSASNNQIGTTGKSKALEAVKFALTGDDASNYSIYYRVHVSGIGWLDWAKNGESAGTDLYKNIEAIQIKIQNIDENAPGNEETPFKSVTKGTTHIEYNSHVQNIGWQNVITDGQTAGTTGKSYRIEAFRAQVIGDENLSVNYEAHVQNVGWQGTKSDGEICGTTGKSYRIEALRMSLKGTNADNYDLYYRVHVANVGWLDWASNGKDAGSVGKGLRIEALQVVLKEKGETAPGNTSNYFIETPSINYSTNYDNSWHDVVVDGNTSGTTGQSKTINLFKASVTSPSITGGIQYSSHVQNVGWTSYTSGESGRTNLRLEAIKIKLTGQLSGIYDVYYRVHVQNFGWLGWAKNDQQAGSQGYGYRIEAIQVKLCPKNTGGAPSTGNSFKKYNPDWVSSLSIASKADRIVTVTGNGGSYATVQFHHKSNGVWYQDFSVSGRIGKNGFSSNRHEGDYTTPTGTYKLGQAFGIANNPGCPVGYHKVTKYDYWGGTRNGNYNKMFDSRNSRAYSNDEHLIKYTTAYQYCVNTGFNPSNTYGKGSAIFLHCSTGGPTAGCVSISNANMAYVLRNLTNNSYIYLRA
ncbi:MAG: hypothetical protein PHH04_00915 [Thomasclavelia sp.]|jgi:uncharacterized protein YjdB|nr:hypothetical protein [Thomasclavelia sp.]